MVSVPQKSKASDASSARQRIAIVYGPLLFYRVALFEQLGLRYDLTVFATEHRTSETIQNFKLEIVPARRFGRFQLQPGLRKKIKKGRFDACISFLDVGHLDSLMAVFRPSSQSVFCWGPWITDSALANRVRLAAIRRSSATVLYCGQHLNEFVRAGADPEKLYVAQNTIAVSRACLPPPPEARDSIVFVGSLDARKGLDRLIRIFGRIAHQLPRHVRLLIVGNGSVRSGISALVRALNLVDRVQMVEGTTDPALLARIYGRALLSVSLNQAGLAVLQSFGHGVPFLTTNNCISGGEANNIIHGVNGLRVEDRDSEIEANLLAMASDPERCTGMGVSARQHYWQYASIENMAQGFIDMLEGTRQAEVFSDLKEYPR